MAQSDPFLQFFDTVLPGAGTVWLDQLRNDAQEFLVPTITVGIPIVIHTTREIRIWTWANSGQLL